MGMGVSNPPNAAPRPRRLAPRTKALPQPDKTVDYYRIGGQISNLAVTTPQQFAGLASKGSGLGFLTLFTLDAKDPMASHGHPRVWLGVQRRVLRRH